MSVTSRKLEERRAGRFLHRGPRGKKLSHRIKSPTLAALKRYAIRTPVKNESYHLARNAYCMLPPFELGRADQESVNGQFNIVTTKVSTEQVDTFIRWSQERAQLTFCGEAGPVQVTHTHPVSGTTPPPERGQLTQAPLCVAQGRNTRREHSRLHVLRDGKGVHHPQVDNSNHNFWNQILPSHLCAAQK